MTMKKFLALGLVLFTLALIGCETTKGIGRDFQNAGQWIQEKAN
jgi:predicted small secreted protein